MNFHVITLFPEMIENALSYSVIGRSIGNGIINLDTISLRAFSVNSYGSVDDYTYGGGAGMLISCEPVWGAYQEAVSRVIKNREEEEEGYDLPEKKIRVIYTSPAGTLFNEKKAEELSKEDDLIFLCGHYEGVDQRVIDKIVTDEISIGDYVLTGGELPSLVIMDAVARRVNGVLNNSGSPESESFENGLIEYAQYTRPAEWMGEKVPEILLSGDHAKVETWRITSSKERTKKVRPEMLEKWYRERGIF